MYALAREGAPAEALAAHRALNEVLAEKGIAPLPLPGALRRAVD
jgi:molybdopterin biosynthesis enzyme